MSKAKVATVAVTGTVVKCELKSRRASFGWRAFDKGREHYDISLQITLKAEDGQRYCFYTAAAHYTVTTSGPFTVAIITPNDWIAKSEERWDCEGFAGARGFGHKYESRIKVGDTLSIEGRVKNAHTRYGILLNYVRRQGGGL